MQFQLNSPLGSSMVYLAERDFSPPPKKYIYFKLPRRGFLHFLQDSNKMYVMQYMKPIILYNNRFLCEITLKCTIGPQKIKYQKQTLNMFV